jgi:hypothetical protein
LGLSILVNVLELLFSANLQNVKITLENILNSPEKCWPNISILCYNFFVKRFEYNFKINLEMKFKIANARILFNKKFHLLCFMITLMLKEIGMVA